MAFFSPRDAGFWDMEPEFLQSVQDACTPFGLKILHFVLGDKEDPSTPVAAMLEMPPGYVLPRHAHAVTRFEVIVKGSLTVGNRDYVAGDVMVSPPNEFYGPHIAGPDGCTTVEFFSSILGTGNTIYETAEGLERVSYRS